MKKADADIPWLALSIWIIFIVKDDTLANL